MLKDFKKFVLRGNVVDLAVAVVVGAAFNSVIQSIVKDFITPLIVGISKNGKLISGKLVIDQRFIFNWGDFINTLLSFLIVATVVFFFVVQPITKLQKISTKNVESTTKKCPECLNDIPKKASRCGFCGIKIKNNTN